METTKKCNICKLEKPLIEFVKEGGVGQKTTKACRSCREIALSYYYGDHEKKKNEAKEYRKNHKGYYSNYLKEWKNSNKEELGKEDSYDNKRYREDIRFRTISLENKRPRLLVRAKNNSPKRAVAALGCTRDEFRAYIEALFEPGMNWDNMGSAWEFDHHFPLSVAYDYGPEIFKMACHFSNVKPLWSGKNLAKGFSVPEDSPVKKYIEDNGLVKEETLSGAVALYYPLLRTSTKLSEPVKKLELPKPPTVSTKPIEPKKPFSWDD